EQGVAAMNQLGWRGGDVVRMAFLIGDAPPHEQNAASFISQMETAQRADIRMYPVGASGVEETAEYLFRLAAQMTSGRYLFLTDDSGIGNSHEIPHIPCFQVQTLNRLMVRMIASELSGTRVAPEARDILRSVGSPENGT